MVSYVQRVLFKYSHTLFLLHGVAITLFCLVPFFLLHTPIADFDLFPYSTLILLVIGLIGFCQNIGFVHELAHRLPFSSHLRLLNWFVLLFFHALGGLRPSMTVFLHLNHHKFLGEPNDPDRNGYTEHTLTKWDRIFYLFFIGPLRKKWAPVDTDSSLAALPEQQRRYMLRRNRGEWFFLIFLHGTLCVLLRWDYFYLLGCLIVANVFSNLREMTEHGQGKEGKAAYVNMSPHVLGVLFFSTPGFWYHGTHHQFPHIPYWQLPFSAASPNLLPKSTAHSNQVKIPFLYRSSYFRYLWSGK